MPEKVDAGVCTVVDGLSLDWSSTTVGVISSWPQELLVLVNLAMLSPQPQLFLLGPDSIILYNTAYGRLLRDHHPLYQGRPIGLNSALIANAPAINRIRGRARTKTSPANENSVPFFFLQHGRLEEVFLSATMVHLPLSLDGYHATTYDTTHETVQARRHQSIEALLAGCERAKDLPSLWTAVLDGLELSDGEISFAVLYRSDSEITRDDTTNRTSSRIDAQKLSLVGTIGHFETPLSPRLDLNDYQGLDQSMHTALRKAVDERILALLQSEDGTLPEPLCKAACNRCYGDQCLEAVVLPSAMESDVDVHGVLIIGLAPRRPYDDTYQAWIRTLHRIFANLVASITITEARNLAKEDETRRAVKEKEALAAELSLKRREVALASGKVDRMLGIMQAARSVSLWCLSRPRLTYLR